MNETMYYFFFALSIVLIVLGSVVSAQAKKTDSTAQSNVKNSGMGVLVIGLIFFVGSGFAIFHKMGGTEKLYYF